VFPSRCICAARDRETPRPGRLAAEFRIEFSFFVAAEPRGEEFRTSAEICAHARIVSIALRSASGDEAASWTY